MRISELQVCRETWHWQFRIGLVGGAGRRSLVELAMFLLYVQDATEDADEHYHDELMPVLLAEEARPRTALG